MARGYSIAHVEVDDMDSYKNYIAAHAAPFDARFLMRSGEQAVPEFDRNVSAAVCCESIAYQQAKAIGDRALNAHMLLARGYDG